MRARRKYPPIFMIDPSACDPDGASSCNVDPDLDVEDDGDEGDALAVASTTQDNTQVTRSLH
jgi:hypothetical protein